MSRLNNALKFLRNKHGFTPCIDNYEKRGTVLVTQQQCKDSSCVHCIAYSAVLIPNQKRVLDVQTK